jgi:autotransporter-associated beta strand protein
MGALSGYTIKFNIIGHKDMIMPLLASLLILVSVHISNAQLAKCKGKYLGNIIATSAPSNYGILWNQVTPENGTKWGTVEKNRGEYNWLEADIAYNWAKENGALFKFHTLVWGSQMPDWVVESLSRAELKESVENYIKAAADHFNPKGGLDMIDVINEPANPVLPDFMKEALTLGYQSEPANAGDPDNPYGWIIWPYQLARKYFPNSVLLTNEYNIEENWQQMREPYITIINALKKAPNLSNGEKNLLDGVGLQCHGVHQLTAEKFKACLDEIWEKTGLPMHITEFDQVASPTEEKQKDVYSTLIPVAWEHPHVAGITLWGYVQGSTWLKGNSQEGPTGTDSGLQYAPSYQANPSGDRPALTWLKQYMAAQEPLPCCPAPRPMGKCTAPSVSLTSPQANSSYSNISSIQLSAAASDTDGYIRSVSFYSGTDLLGTAYSQPYNMQWENPGSGSHIVTAVAKDNDGIETVSAQVNITVKNPRNYIYSCSGCSSPQWTTETNWEPAGRPLETDTAIIRTGEVLVKINPGAHIKVEPEGLFRLTANVTAPEVRLQGGTLKSFTSTPLFILTSSLIVEKASTIWAGSQIASVFEIKGNISGSGKLAKTHTGILRLSADASAYSGNWDITAGTLQLASSSGLGTGSVVIAQGASLHIDASGIFIDSAAISGTLALNNSLTARASSIAGIPLPAGTYSAADFPAIISGTGTLTVQQCAGCPTRQAVALSPGWNLISTNVHPTDSSIATLFAGLDVAEIKDMNTYWRKEQPSFLNLLQTITAGQGYLVNMNTAGTLTVTGTHCTGVLQYAPTGWQLIGCPYQTATPISGILGSNISVIKNFDGFWMPNEAASSIENLEPGKAYFTLLATGK